MKNPESNLQQACVRWFRFAHPGKILFAIPNGGKRGVITASIMKAEGVLRGISDLMLLFPSQGHHGLFIEMKAEKGRMTPEQIQFFETARKLNYKCEECRSFDQFMEIITNYLK